MPPNDPPACQWGLGSPCLSAGRCVPLPRPHQEALTIPMHGKRAACPSSLPSVCCRPCMDTPGTKKEHQHQWININGSTVTHRNNKASQYFFPLHNWTFFKHEPRNLCSFHLQQSLEGQEAVQLVLSISLPDHKGQLACLKFICATFSIT